MQNTYHSTDRPQARGRRGRKIEWGRAERKRFIQLIASVALFLTVFIGKGILPDGMTAMAGRLRSVLHSNTDFAAAFSEAGDAISNGASVWDTIGDFCVAVFGQAPAIQPDDEVAEGELSYPAERARLAHGEGLAANSLASYQQWEVQQLPQEEPEEPAVQRETQETLPVGAVVKEMSYTGDALPERVSMEWLSLGDLVTQDPVQGVLTSTFSYRTHPVDGEYKFHYGADLAADYGTEIGAFADGVVEFTGESDGYGLYVQVDHGNGIKSFYAHCSRVCVRQGQSVSRGETVALVGDTGIATGPHLHFQIKLNDTWLNPLYYISARA